MILDEPAMMAAVRSTVLWTSVDVKACVTSGALRRVLAQHSRSTRLVFDDCFERQSPSSDVRLCHRRRIRRTRLTLSRSGDSFTITKTKTETTDK